MPDDPRVPVGQDGDPEIRDEAPLSDSGGAADADSPAADGAAVPDPETLPDLVVEGAVSEERRQAEGMIIPEYESAIERGSASFEQLAETAFLKQARFVEDPVIRLVNERYFPSITDAFEKAHGAIRKSYYCANVIAAVVVTEKDEFHLAFNLGASPVVERLLFRCNQINFEAQRLLPPKPLRACVDMLYGVASYLLSILDEFAGERDDEGDARLESIMASLPAIREELARADAYRLRAVSRNAQVNYFKGMLWGAAATVLIGSLLWTVLTVTSVQDLQPTIFLATFLAGGIGGIVSVMTRMTSGELQLQYEAEADHLRLLGAFRPLIGSVFGVAIYSLSASGLLPLEQPEAATAFFLYTSIGFLAGFSERWARDMLDFGRQRIRGQQEGDSQLPPVEPRDSDPDREPGERPDPPVPPGGSAGPAATSSATSSGAST